MVDVFAKYPLRRHVVTSKILKFEENKRESRNIGFENDMKMIILKCPYNFFFTTILSLYSELLITFQDKISLT